MGGRGSGRRAGYGGKPETDDATPLDIRKLSRKGLLVPGNNFSWEWTVNNRVVSSISLRVERQALVLSYRKRSTGENIEQRVQIQTSACHLGGQRQWFTCPKCARRVAVLYSPGRYFECRQCGELAYASQKEGAGDRSIRQADRIRKRLGWVAGIAHGDGGKPVGMHWQTFWRLKAKHDALVQVSLHDVARKLGFLHRLLKP